MTDKNTYALSRRKALAGLTTIGVAGAGAGLGTTALFSDEESFTNNQLTAGTLDLVVDYATSRTSADESSATGTRDGSNSNPATYEYVLEDVKPGDSGGLVFCPKIIDNPGYLWLGSNDGPTSNENGYTEPEPSSNDELDDPVVETLTDPGNADGGGELDQATQVSIYFVDTLDGNTVDDFIDGGEVNCDPNDNEKLSSDVTRREVEEETITNLGELGEALESGLPLPNGNDEWPASEDGDDQTGPCICIEWEVPLEVGNVIQGDSWSVDFTFDAVQSRNNPDNVNPFAVEVDSESELVSALQNSNGVTLTEGYRDGLNSVSRETTFSPSGNQDTFDVYDINTGTNLGSEGALRQYAYIRENGQVRTAAGAVNPNTQVLRIFVNQGESGELVIVATDQPNDGDFTIEELSSAAKVVTVDANIS